MATAEMVFGRYINERQNALKRTPDVRITANKVAKNIAIIPPINHILNIFIRDWRKS